MTSDKKSSLGLNISLAIGSVLILLIFVEIIFRVIGYDFSGKQQAFEAWPIFYRQPRVPVGDVFFRRPGPDVWKGKPLTTGLKMANTVDKAYADESRVVIEYDKDGFRNPKGLADWEIVVIGDSFTELGYLPYKDLFSTQLGKALGKRVKNLGVSYTGPLTYEFFLREYGKSINTKHAMMVFFEGNDLKDIQKTGKRIRNFKKTGKREYRETEIQTSVIKACLNFFQPPKEKPKPKRKVLYQNAFFKSSNMGDIPLSVYYTPPGKNKLTKNHRDQVETALSKWANTARGLGLKPWLVYMPCKRRVLDGKLQFTKNASKHVINWRPSDLPVYINKISDKYGIEFVDVTSALKKETNKGELTYNPIWDTHLNIRGSYVVSQVITEAVKKYENFNNQNLIP